MSVSFYFYTYSKENFHTCLLCRKLTAEQKKLMSEFAELDKDTQGTVYGSSKTSTGT